MAPAIRVARRHSRRRATRGGLPAPDTGPGTCAVVQLAGNATGRSATVLMRHGGLRVPNHNVLEIDDLLVYNDTASGALATFDLRNGARGPSVPVPGSPPYARGLAALGDATFVVGSQRPAAVHVVDLAEERVTSSVVLGEDPRESVFGVAIVPDSFDDPSERLDFCLTA
jgi:hypothetical protein